MHYSYEKAHPALAMVFCGIALPAFSIRIRDSGHKPQAATVDDIGRCARSPLDQRIHRTFDICSRTTDGDFAGITIEYPL